MRKFALCIACWAACLYGRQAMAEDVNLEWDASPSPGAIGYRLYHGPTDGGPYPTMVDVGNVLSHTLTGLSLPAYVVATAYPDPLDTGSSESVFSNQVIVLAQADTTPPTFIQEAETVWDTVADKTTSSFPVLAGDILVAVAVSEGSNTGAFTISGGSLVWTKQQEVLVSQYAVVAVFTATVDVDKTMAVTIADSGTTLFFGGNVLTFRGSSGVGASAKTNVDGGAPTLNLTTTQANSAIVVASGDWNGGDGASRIWRTNAGELTERSYSLVAVRYTAYVGSHANAGPVGTYAVGLSAPAGQKYSIAAVEVMNTPVSSQPIPAAPSGWQVIPN